MPRYVGNGVQVVLGEGAGTSLTDLGVSVHSAELPVHPDEFVALTVRLSGNVKLVAADGHVLADLSGIRQSVNPPPVEPRRVGRLRIVSDLRARRRVR